LKIAGKAYLALAIAGAVAAGLIRMMDLIRSGTWDVVLPGWLWALAGFGVLLLVLFFTLGGQLAEQVSLARWRMRLAQAGTVVFVLAGLALAAWSEQSMPGNILLVLAALSAVLSLLMAARRES
jgi:hypothetical protein